MPSAQEMHLQEQLQDNRSRSHYGREHNPYQHIFLLSRVGVPDQIRSPCFFIRLFSDANSSGLFKNKLMTINNISNHGSMINLLIFAGNATSAHSRHFMSLCLLSRRLQKVCKLYCFTLGFCSWRRRFFPAQLQRCCPELPWWQSPDQSLWTDWK